MKDLEKGVVGVNRHLLVTLLCCTIPLLVILALPYLGVSLSSSRWLPLVLLLCPLMHLLLMRGHWSQRQHPGENDGEAGRRNPQD